MQVNYKKEMQNLGKYSFHRLTIDLERMSEIQYQNRILLKKMLQIDLKASELNPTTQMEKKLHSGKESNPSGLNAYNSLNRATRIKDLAGIVDSNRRVLDRL